MPRMNELCTTIGVSFLLVYSDSRGGVQVMQSGYKVSLGLAIVGFGVACYSMLSTAAGVGARAVAHPGTLPLLYLLYLAISPQRVTHCSKHSVCDTRSSKASKAVCNTRCSTVLQRVSHTADR